MVSSYIKTLIIANYMTKLKQKTNNNPLIFISFIIINHIVMFPMTRGTFDHDLIIKKGLISLPDLVIYWDFAYYIFMFANPLPSTSHDTD